MLLLRMVERKATDVGPDFEDDEEWEYAQSGFAREDARSSGGKSPPEREREFQEDAHDHEQGSAGEEESGKRGRLCPECPNPFQLGEITCGHCVFASESMEKKRHRNEQQDTDQMLNI